MRLYASICVLVAAFGLSASASDEVTLRICSDAVVIADNEAEAQGFRDEGTRGGGVLVACKRLRITCDANTYIVACEDFSFITAAGVEGAAKQATFDLKSNRVILTGKKGSPVHLIVDADSDDDATHVSFDRLEMTLSLQRSQVRHTKTRGAK